MMQQYHLISEDLVSKLFDNSYYHYYLITGNLALIESVEKNVCTFICRIYTISAFKISLFGTGKISII